MRIGSRLPSQSCQNVQYPDACVLHAADMLNTRFSFSTNRSSHNISQNLWYFAVSEIFLGEIPIHWNHRRENSTAFIPRNGYFRSPIFLPILLWLHCVNTAGYYPSLINTSQLHEVVFCWVHLITSCSIKSVWFFLCWHWVSIRFVFNESRH